MFCSWWLVLIGLVVVGAYMSIKFLGWCFSPFFGEVKPLGVKTGTPALPTEATETKPTVLTAVEKRERLRVLDEEASRLRNELLVKAVDDADGCQPFRLEAMNGGK